MIIFHLLFAISAETLDHPQVNVPVTVADWRLDGD